MSPRIRYVFPEDERPTPAPPDDGGDGWWAGAQHCFVAIPLAASLATVALSASLAFGYQQQTDEIVPQPVAFAGEEQDWRVPVVVEQTRFVSLWTSSAAASTPPAFMPDEAGWSPPLPSPRWRPRVFLADDEIVPQPAAAMATDDDPTVWVSAAPRPTITVFRAEDELPRLQADDDAWQVAPPRPAPLRFLYLPEPEPEWTPTPVFAPAEDDWQPPRPAPACLCAVPWAATDDIVPQPSFRPQDDPWEPTVLRSRPVLAIWWGNDEIATAPVPLAAEEDGWQPPRPWPSTVLLVPWASSDEIVPESTFTPEEDGWSPVAAPRRHAPTVWWADEEIVPAPAAPALDEGYWQAPVIWQGKPLPRSLWGEDDPVPPTLGAEDDAWVAAPLRASQPTVRVFLADDEIVPGPAPGVPEEDPWAVHVPRIAPVLTVWQVGDDIVPEAEGEAIVGFVSPGRVLGFVSPDRVLGFLSLEGPR